MNMTVPQKILDLQENKVTQSNSLVEASYRLTLDEKRLLILAISKVDSRKTVPTTVVVTAEEFATLYGLKQQSGYIQLKEAASTLFDRSISFKDGEDDGRQHWVSKAIYRAGLGRVDMNFAPELWPYISEIKDNFTSFQIGNIKDLRSVYSIRLYELLWKYISEERRWLSISDLRDKFKLEEKYSKYADLRRNVIEPAIKEINEKTNLNVTFKPEKDGKNVIKLWFFFSEKKQTTMTF